MAAPASADEGGGDGGQQACAATDLTLVSQIQGAGFDSPLDGDPVTVRVALTGSYPGLGGITVQEKAADTDSDPATSEGVFVFVGYDADTSTLDRGDVVQVTGTVDERFGNTQIDGDHGP